MCMGAITPASSANSMHVRTNLRKRRASCCVALMGTIDRRERV